MSDCSDKNEDDTIETKELTYASRDETYSYTTPDSCPSDRSGTYSDRYEIGLQITAPYGPNEAKDEIANQKRWLAESHFVDPPTDLTNYDDCQYISNNARAWTVEYLAKHGYTDNDTTSDYFFKDPVPNGDPNDGIGNDILALLITLGGAATGNPYAAAGAAFIASYIPEFDDPVDFDGQSYQNTVEQSWHWDIDMEPPFPDAPCNSTGIQFTIEDSSGAGTDHTVEVDTRYTFRYRTYVGCEFCDSTKLEGYFKTTPYTYSYSDWTSVS